jgi:lysine 2,3-aminomutase
MRFATKGPAIMPMKVLTDDDWFSALVQVVHEGRLQDKDVVLHTHFNSAQEITEISHRAASRLFREGIVVRNQSVLMRGVNDSIDRMGSLVRELGFMNIHPYYVYQHDMVRGVEDLRTTVQTAIDLEVAVRGLTAGFNTPTFVVDAPGGGGKRVVHSFVYYDRSKGISAYKSPNVDPDRLYFYFDPLEDLPEEGRQFWMDTEAVDSHLAQLAGVGNR